MQETKVDIKQLVIKKVTADVTASTTLDTDTIIIYSVYLPNFKNLKSELETFLNKAESERVSIL
jgi:hypothetical protein